jgi:hypothetical protein
VQSGYLGDQVKRHGALQPDQGIRSWYTIQDVYLGHSGGLLMESARAAQEAGEMAEAITQSKDVVQRKN